MASPCLRVILPALLVISMSFSVSAADEDPLQDTCVADLSCKLPINGLVCKPKERECPQDFKSDVLKYPGNVNNKLGFNATVANVFTFPGVNTQGVSMVRLDFCPGGVAPPHIHPRASEILFCLQGTLYLGFVDTMNNLLATNICAGELFVFPRGLIHFVECCGPEPCMSLSGFNSQNPGVNFVGKALFDCKPPIKKGVLEKAFGVSSETVQETKHKVASQQT